MIARFLSWIHHQPQPAWGDPYRTAAPVTENESVAAEEEDIDAPPAVAVVRDGAIGPQSLPPTYWWLCLSAALIVSAAIAIVAISQRDCKKVVVNDSNGDPAVAQICR